MLKIKGRLQKSPSNGVCVIFTSLSCHFPGAETGDHAYVSMLTLLHCKWRCFHNLVTRVSTSSSICFSLFLLSMINILKQLITFTRAKGEEEMPIKDRLLAKETGRKAFLTCFFPHSIGRGYKIVSRAFVPESFFEFLPQNTRNHWNCLRFLRFYFFALF